MLEILKGAKYSWVILSLVLSILAFISRAMRWALLIEPLGKKPKFWNTYHAVLTGYLANYALPRMGEITRCIALNRKERIPVDSLIGTVVIERTIDLISLLVIMLLLLIIRFEKFGQFFQEYIFDNLGEKATGLVDGSLLLILLILGFVLAAVIVLLLFRNYLRGLKLYNRLKEILKRVISGIRSVASMRQKWLFLAHTLFIWTMYALMTWVVVFALPGITNELTLADGIFLLVIGSLGMAAPVQAGIGAFHWIVSMGLVTVYGLGETEALSFASLQHTSQTLLVFLLGSISLVVLYTRPSRKSPKID